MENKGWLPILEGIALANFNYLLCVEGEGVELTDYVRKVEERLTNMQLKHACIGKMREKGGDE